LPTVHVRVHYASDRDQEVWSRRMFYDVDPNARRRVVAEFALEVKPKVRGVPEALTPHEVAKYVFTGFSGVGPPLAAFRKAGVRHMTVGDVVEVDGVKFLRKLTGFERVP
jgi:hypothetical protein